MTNVENATPAPAPRSRNLAPLTITKLQEVIEEDAAWVHHYKYLPPIKNAGLKFIAIPETKRQIRQIDYKLYTGTFDTPEPVPVYAYVRFFQNVPNVVELHYEEGGKTQIQRINTEERVTTLTKTIKLVKPFDELKRSCNTIWMNQLRFLILYYFLERGCLERITFTSIGQDALKKACATIADAAIHGSCKPARMKVTKMKRVVKDPKTVYSGSGSEDKQHANRETKSACSTESNNKNTQPATRVPLPISKSYDASKASPMIQEKEPNMTIPDDHKNLNRHVAVPTDKQNTVVKPGTPDPQKKT